MSIQTLLLEPIKLNPDFAAGKDLEPMVPWPEQIQLKPVGAHRTKIWFTSSTLTTAVYEADGGTLQFVDFPYDEQVTVLKGTAVLTTSDGTSQRFNAGDVFAVPKGWNGTWEMSTDYRELITFETSSLERALALWGWA